MTLVVWSQVFLFCLGLCTGIGGSWVWGQQGKRQRRDRSWSGGDPIDPPPALVVSPPEPAWAAADRWDSPTGPPAAIAGPIAGATTEAHTAIASLQDLQLANYYAGFLARTSHELRSPLSSLMSLHQIVLNDLCDDAAEERQCVQQAYNAAQRLLEMLELVTQLSKLEMGNHPRHIQPSPLFQVLQDVQMLTRLQLANRNVHLTLDLPEPDLMVQVAPGCLRQALLCLITSMVEESQGRQAHLKYRCEPEQGRVYLLLEDDRASDAWQKPQDLLTATPAPSPEALLAQIRDAKDLPLPYLSSEMLLLLARGFLELSGGQLKITPGNSPADPMSGSIQLSLALAA